MKKRYRFCLVSGSVLLIAFIAIAYFVYVNKYRKTVVSSYDQDQYRLTIYQIGEPDFPFGQGNCRLALTEDDRTVDELDFVLNNDGKWPDSSNFTVKWQQDNVSVTVHGEEQNDKTYVLYFD